MDQQGAKALFLDLDGTLAGSMEVMWSIYADCLAAYGVPMNNVMSTQEFYKLGGRTTEDILEETRQRHGIRDSLEEMVAAYYHQVEQRYQNHAKLMPGGRRLLEGVVQRGVFCCVVTGARTSVAQGFLKHQGLNHMVKCIVSADDVTRGKPDPEPYSLALKLSGQPADRALAVEDARNGAISATKAGIDTWVITPKGHQGFPNIPGVKGFITGLEQLIPCLDAS